MPADTHVSSGRHRTQVQLSSSRALQHTWRQLTSHLSLRSLVSPSQPCPPPALRRSPFSHFGHQPTSVSTSCNTCHHSTRVGSSGPRAQRLSTASTRCAKLRLKRTPAALGPANTAPERTRSPRRVVLPSLRHGRAQRLRAHMPLMLCRRADPSQQLPGSSSFLGPPPITRRSHALCSETSEHRRRAPHAQLPLSARPTRSTLDSSESPPPCPALHLTTLHLPTVPRGTCLRAAHACLRSLRPAPRPPLSAPHRGTNPPPQLPSSHRRALLHRASNPPPPPQAQLPASAPPATRLQRRRLHPACRIRSCLHTHCSKPPLRRRWRLCRRPLNCSCS